MRIALLDDDPIWLKKASASLETYAENQNLDISLIQFSNGQDLLSYTGEPIDAAFVDIVLDQENGVDLGAKLNSLWPDCRIVYCTDYIDYAMDVYETRHTYFLVKSQLDLRLDLIMKKLTLEQKEMKQEIFFHVIKGEMTRFLLRDIYLLERKDRVTLVKTVHGSYKIREKIADILPCLPPVIFTRCHNSFIVNCSFVDQKNRASYELKDGNIIPISRRYAADTKKDYLTWCARQMD